MVQSQWPQGARQGRGSFEELPVAEYLEGAAAQLLVVELELCAQLTQRASAIETQAQVGFRGWPPALHARTGEELQPPTPHARQSGHAQQQGRVITTQPLQQLQRRAGCVPGIGLAG